MNCEYCGRSLREGDTIHGLRYGTVEGATDIFLPARDSAPTVICGPCGNMVYKLIYVKLQPAINPSLYKTLTQTR